MMSPKQQRRYIVKRLHRTRRAIRAHSVALAREWDRQLATRRDLSITDRVRILQYWGTGYRIKFPINARIRYSFYTENNTGYNAAQLYRDPMLYAF
jgi:hypothetical protein